MSAFGSVIQSAVFQCLDRALYDCQRGTQFMGDVGYEGVLGLVRPTQILGHNIEGLSQVIQLTVSRHVVTLIWPGDAAGEERSGNQSQPDGG